MSRECAKNLLNSIIDNQKTHFNAQNNINEKFRAKIQLKV